MRLLKIITVLILALPPALPLVQATEPARPILLVHPDSPIDVLDRAKILSIYQGKVRRVEGRTLVLATLRPGTTHEQFAREYLGRSGSQFDNYWRKMVFSGKGRLPRSFEAESDLVRFVAETPGAIGYIDPSTPHPGVKVVKAE